MWSAEVPILKGCRPKSYIATLMELAACFAQVLTRVYPIGTIVLLNDRGCKFATIAGAINGIATAADI